LVTTAAIRLHRRSVTSNCRCSCNSAGTCTWVVAVARPETWLRPISYWNRRSLAFYSRVTLVRSRDREMLSRLELRQPPRRLVFLPRNGGCASCLAPIRLRKQRSYVTRYWSICAGWRAGSRRNSLRSVVSAGLPSKIVEPNASSLRLYHGQLA
jgi:hypothetical protein